MACDAVLRVRLQGRRNLVATLIRPIFIRVVLFCDFNLCSIFSISGHESLMKVPNFNRASLALFLVPDSVSNTYKWKFTPHSLLVTVVPSE